MSFDNLMMKAITDELREKLGGAPVQRVYQPGREEIVLHLYSRGSQPGLLVSLDSRHARVHLSASRFKNSPRPSPFCMLLRKYLVGGRAVSFTNPPLERVLEISFAPPDGLPPVKLVVEIMGRRSNLILVGEEETILGAAKTASWEKNPKRAILPGELYRPAPRQDKPDPTAMSYDHFRDIMQVELNSGRNLETALYRSVAGISPLAARELIYRSGLNTLEVEADMGRLYATIQAFFATDALNPRPVTAPEKNLYTSYYPTHLQHEILVEWDSCNKMLDHYYRTLIVEERENALRHKLNRATEKKMASLQEKYAKQEEELRVSDEAPQHRLYGELLLAYGHMTPRGATEVVLPDFYNPGEEVTVPLNPSLAAGANAQHHFRRYRKAKKGRRLIREQLAKTGAEIDYCRELLYAIEHNSGASLEEVEQEMIEAGFLHRTKKARSEKSDAPRPLLFKTSAGHTVLVGRNNRQNDYVTFKAATRRDTWFHAQKIPGSHVILKEAPFPPPPQDIEEAAFLAAYFSRGRESGAVAIDYTAVRHVRRRPGGKPGFVLYENYETITVNPQNPLLQNRFFTEQ